jgi:hypothetical protein
MDEWVPFYVQMICKQSSLGKVFLKCVKVDPDASLVFFFLICDFHIVKYTMLVDMYKLDNYHQIS